MSTHLPQPLAGASSGPASPEQTRRAWCLGAAAALGLGGCASPPRPAAPARPGAPLPFSTSTGIGGLPAGWYAEQLRRNLPATHYALADQDGRRVMHAVADSSTSALRCEVDIDPLQLPWLEWAWRVDEVPASATVADDERDDSPARVMVAFDGDAALIPLRDRLFQDQVELFTGVLLPFAMLMYVWDGQAPTESVLRYQRSGRIRYLVVESGSGATGQWRHYRRNVVDDYRRVFGAEPGRISSVGVATDSDDLKIRTEAWFGDLRFDSR